MAQRHSTPIRGLMSTGRSPQFQGRFGRMFRSLHPATFGATEAENLKNLAVLGAQMSATFDPPTDGKDPEESGIPALYTYLGQFIDHDITFDPSSSLQMQDVLALMGRSRRFLGRFCKPSLACSRAQMLRILKTLRTLSIR